MWGFFLFPSVAAGLMGDVQWRTAARWPRLRSGSQLQTASALAGDNDSLFTGNRIVFSISLSSSIPPSPFTSPHPLLPSPLSPGSGRWRRSIAPRRRWRWRRTADESKPPYFPSVLLPLLHSLALSPSLSLAVPDWIWGFSSSFSSLCLPWNYLELPGTWPSGKLMMLYRFCIKRTKVFFDVVFLLSSHSCRWFDLKFIPCPIFIS